MARDYQEIKLAKEGPVAILTLNRPEKLNAFTLPMLFGEIPAAITEVADSDDVRVLIITGAGRGFCAGADVKANFVAQIEGESQKSQTPEPWGRRYGLIHQLRNLPKPTIAAVNGPAAGAGLSLAMACDIRIASADARFSSAFVRRGLVPDCGGTFFLPRLIGPGRAMELTFTGDIIDAREADRIGLVNRIVPAAELMPAAMDLAGRIAKNPPIALALAKRISYQWLEQDLMSQLEYEAYNQKLCRETDDHKEAVRAFMEKREGHYVGR